MNQPTEMWMENTGLVRIFVACVCHVMTILIFMEENRFTRSSGWKNICDPAIIFLRKGFCHFIYFCYALCWLPKCTCTL